MISCYCQANYLANRWLQRQSDFLNSIGIRKLGCDHFASGDDLRSNIDALILSGSNQV